LERYIQMNLRLELAQAQQHMVQNQTATMLELGTSLLNQTTAQTRKLTDVEAQVLNQTSRMEIQLLETSLSTNKLEKQLLLQGHELHQLQGHNRNTGATMSFHSQLLESVQRLVRVVAQGPASMRAAEQVFCDMEASGGGWTLIQRRENGSMNFQRNWRDYKQGFGNPAGEHWLGNEVVHQLTSRAAYSLRVELQDWEGNEAYAQYEHFQLGSEGQLYRWAWGPGSWAFSEWVQRLGGAPEQPGWWFDACGLSNLNGIYYPARHHVRKLNGIRWHYFQGPSYSLRSTRMMVRPTDI
ncbi:hypothetical protein E2I00_005077, partial [Balaenoptera physalus]